MSIFLLLNANTTIKLRPCCYQDELSTRLILRYLKGVGHRFYYRGYIRHPASKSLIKDLLRQE